MNPERRIRRWLKARRAPRGAYVLLTDSGAVARWCERERAEAEYKDRLPEGWRWYSLNITAGDRAVCIGPCGFAGRRSLADLAAAGVGIAHHPEGGNDYIAVPSTDPEHDCDCGGCVSPTDRECPAARSDTTSR